MKTDGIIDVTQLTDEDREALGLSTWNSTIDVVGDQSLVEEACAYARSVKLVGFDLETTGLDKFEDDIILFQIGDLNRQYLIWYQTIDPTPLLEVLADETICKAGVNLKFDLSFILAKHGLDKRAWNVADANIVEQVLNCGLTGGTGQTLTMSSMGAMAKRWLHLELPKDEDIRTGWGNMTPGEWEGLEDKRYYAADDVCVPLLLLQKQKPWIKQFELVNTVNLEHAFLPVLAEVETRGIKIDIEGWNELYEEALEKVRDATRQLDKIFKVTKTISISRTGEIHVVRDKNYGSTDQLKELMREYMRNTYGYDLICNNAHFRESLEAQGKLNPYRVERLFQSHLIPDPDKPGKNKKVGDPRGTDILEEFWDLYQRYLPDNVIRLPDTDSDTLRLYKIIWETPDNEKDPQLPTQVGLPPELVQPILDLRGHAKNASTYGAKWFERVSKTTGRVHTNFQQTALDTGRLSSSPNCYDKETEILTARGWVPFPELREDDRVAQFDKHSEQISFAVPERVTKRWYEGEMVHISSQQLELMVTPDHRLLFEKRSGEKVTTLAEDWPGDDYKILHTGIYVGGNSPLTPDETRLLVAIQADGNYHDGGIDFGFRKRRKYDRLKELLDRLKLSYSEYTTDPTTLQLRILKKSAAKYMEILGEDKSFGPWILDLSRESLDVFVSELWYWDGSYTRKNHYSSSNKNNADWVQAAIACSGNRARMRPYAAKSGNTNWQVDITRRRHSWTTNVKPRRVAYNDYVYCVTVPKDVIIVRRRSADGRYKVTICHQCQNLPRDPRYRACFVPEPGYKYVGLDWSQIEPRVIAQISKDPTYMRVFWSAFPEHPNFNKWCGPDVTEPLDLYAQVGATVGVLPAHVVTERLAKSTPEFADGRQQAKTIVLGLGYGTGVTKFWYTLMRDTGRHYPYSYAEKLHRGFWSSVAAVKEALDTSSNLVNPSFSQRKVWHPLVKCEVTWAETLGGRKRFFHPDNPAWWTQGRNMGIQGCAGGDILKQTAVLFARWCWENNIDGGIINLIHDEFIVEVREDQSQEAYDALSYYMTVVGEHYLPDVPVTADGYIADCWMKD